jgi:hypothetical protein
MYIIVKFTTRGWEDSYWFAFTSRYSEADTYEGARQFALENPLTFGHGAHTYHEVTVKTHEEVEEWMKEKATSYPYKCNLPAIILGKDEENEDS